MRFVELIQTTPWKYVKRALLEAYPDINPAGYKHVFVQLRTLEPIENTMRIRLTWIEPKNDSDARYVDVNGTDGTRFKDLKESPKFTAASQQSMDEREVTFGLDFKPWNEWLGMNLEPNSLEEFSFEEIVAHCLWEMTFYGFDQTTIQTVFEELNEMIPNLEGKSLEEILQTDDSLVKFGELLGGIEQEPKMTLDETLEDPLAEMVRLNQEMGLYDDAPGPRQIKND
jgi:hypothetical protein